MTRQILIMLYTLKKVGIRAIYYCLHCIDESQYLRNGFSKLQNKQKLVFSKYCEANWFISRLRVCVYSPYYSPYRGVRTRILSSACKTDQAEFTDWTYFLPFNLIREINSNTEDITANTKYLSSGWKNRNDNDLSKNALNKASYCFSPKQ